MLIEFNLKIDVYHHREDEQQIQTQLINFGTIMMEFQTQLGHVASILVELTSAVKAISTDPAAINQATQKLEGVRSRLADVEQANPQPTVT